MQTFNDLSYGFGLITSRRIRRNEFEMVHHQKYKNCLLYNAKYEIKKQGQKAVDLNSSAIIEILTTIND